MKDKARRPTTTPGSEPPPAEVPDLPERWSIQRKTELALRLLRGEALDAVSRESQVPAHELESWKRVFLEQGARGLKTRSDPEERELTLARAKIGDLVMRLELAEYLIAPRSSRRSAPCSRRRPSTAKATARCERGWLIGASRSAASASCGCCGRIN